MRQSSISFSWEPPRCLTNGRSFSGSDSSDSATKTQHPTPTPKQCSVRSAVRQWTNRNVPVSTSKLDSCATIDQISSQSKFSSDKTSKASESNQRSSLSSGIAYENIKALPTRPKCLQGGQLDKQSHCAVEENKPYNVTKPQPDSLHRGSLPVQLNRPVSAVEVNVARSRCHPRRRPCSDSAPAATPKLRRDTDCTEAIVRLIVFFSTKLVHTIWSQASATPKSSKDFNGAGVLPLQVFIQETLRRSKTSYSTLQVALFYLILLRPYVRPCQATQQQYTSSCRALQCGRRMFLTALILASKYLQDRNYSARAWSKISGLPVAEINENERHYLELIKYNLHMTKETFENWSKVVLTICKASGQGPFSRKPESPPSSPDTLGCPAELGQPGSSDWWLYHLSRLAPDMVKDSKATEEYLAGLASSAPLVEPTLSLDTPPSSPESLEEILSIHSSPLVLPSTVLGQTTSSTDGTRISQSPVSTSNIPSRPLPPNLPTPQTTPRYDSAFMFARQPSQSDLRCRASLQAMAGLDKQAVHAANLETCPPPRPRQCTGGTTIPSHPLKECTDSSAIAWLSSPESSYSDSSSSSTRSRSSSVSSVSSVWSVPGQSVRQHDNKPVPLPRTENGAPCLPMPSHARANIGSYSFYHPIGNMHPIPENAKVDGQTPAVSTRCSDTSVNVNSEGCRSSSRSGDISDTQIAQLLASLGSQSDDQVHERTDPAVVDRSVQTGSSKINAQICKKHKRSRSSKEENVLHDEVRQFLWNEPTSVCVKDDKRPTTYVETSDKQAQFPLQQWAHAKKPVPNALHNKRMALQHPSSPAQSNASKLAADFLRQSVAVT